MRPSRVEAVEIGVRVGRGHDEGAIFVDVDAAFAQQIEEQSGDLCSAGRQLDES